MKQCKAYTDFQGKEVEIEDLFTADELEFARNNDVEDRELFFGWRTGYTATELVRLKVLARKVTMFTTEVDEIPKNQSERMYTTFTAMVWKR